MLESNTPTNKQPDSDRQTELLVDVNLMHDIELDEDRLGEMVCKILTDHEVKFAEISVAVVSDKQIHQLNKQYLEHDYETDVLSFNLGETGAVELAGEVIVSADTAIRSAKERGIEPLDELALYVIHGTLHLVGHDDKEERLRKRMRAAEQKYANCFGLQYCDPDQDSAPTDGAV